MKSAKGSVDESCIDPTNWRLIPVIGRENIHFIGLFATFPPLSSALFGEMLFTINQYGCTTADYREGVVGERKSERERERERERGKGGIGGGDLKK